MRRGLSPLARGTPCEPYTVKDIDRFIPAGAGNTRNQRQPILFQSVYPRWRGEHEVVHSQFEAVIGLSPLARGTH